MSDRERRMRAAQITLAVCAFGMVSVALIAAVKAIAIVCFGGAP